MKDVNFHTVSVLKLCAAVYSCKLKEEKAPFKLTLLLHSVFKDEFTNLSITFTSIKKKADPILPVRAGEVLSSGL